MGPKTRGNVLAREVRGARRGKMLQNINTSFSLHGGFLCWMSTVTIIISIVTMLLIESLLLHHMDWGQGSSERQFGTARDWFRSPWPVWGPSPVKSTGYRLGFRLSNGYKTFSDWLWTFGRKARLVKFRLGLDGRGPEVYSHERCRLVGWLDRSSRVVPNVLVWLAELGEWRGRGPMSTPAGRDGWVISGRKGQKVKGSWVSCRGS